MKKTLLNLIISFCGFTAIYGQAEITEAIKQYRTNNPNKIAADQEIFQATIRNGASATQFLIYLRPSQTIPLGTIFAGGAPQVAFSVLGTTAVFTPTYNLGVSSLSTSTEVAGGRSRMVVGATTGIAPTPLPWASGEERLAFTINIASDDTVGARLEHDVTLGTYIFYVADQPTSSDWTTYSDPFFVTSTGAGNSVEGTEGIFKFVTIPGNFVTPVTFANYDVKCNDKGALLTWVTATESNTSKFEIQKSKDGATWVAIDNVTASGNSTSDRSYQYLDLEGGAAFYRIRQVDLDGKSAYTAVKRTSCESNKFAVVLYPVPAKENLMVVINSDKSVRTELQIMDINGKLLRRIPTQINSGNNNFSLNVKDLAAGQYLLTSSDPELPINKKFVVAR